MRRKNVYIYSYSKPARLERFQWKQTKTGEICQSSYKKDGKENEHQRTDSDGNWECVYQGKSSVEKVANIFVKGISSEERERDQRKLLPIHEDRFGFSRKKLICINAVSDEIWIIKVT